MASTRADIWKAAEAGDLDRVSALLGEGVHVDAKDGFGYTPLRVAAMHGHKAIVELLLSRGADKNIRDCYGKTALITATNEGHTAVVQSLLEAGANMDIKDKSGLTALMMGCAWDRIAIVRLLVAAGADMSIKDKDGKTAVHIAAGRRQSAPMEELIAAGADMNVKTSFIGVTPLMDVASDGFTAAVQSLLAAKADMNIQDKDGRTALHHALQRQKSKTAEVLIKAGARLSQQETATGWTPLFFAVQMDSLPLVRLLLENGADPTHKDKQEVTAVDVAKALGYHTIVKELEKCMPVTSQPVVIPFKDLELKEAVGKGSFGVVHKGYWKSSDGARKLVAIKHVDRVDEENVKVLVSLRHPNVITLHGTSENKPYTYLVTDFAENGSLHDFISKRPCSPDLKRALPWAKQIAEGMLYLHRRGIVHRDLKSTNVLLTSQWVAKICDLSVARTEDHTKPMTSVGGQPWMAPEVLMQQPASKLCDVYSYGILLWELTTHDQPFKGISPSLLKTEVNKGVRPLIPESTDVAVKELIEKCWQTKPEDRPIFENILYSLEECEVGKMEYKELDLGKPVGSGSFGQVFKGFWNTKKAGRLPVAIKRVTGMEDETEVKVLSSLRHPNFVHFFGYVKSNPFTFIVTEFAENGSIAGYISAKKGRPVTKLAIKWGREIAEGMCYLHDKGRNFIHRDLKSANVLLTFDLTAMICDLGTAKKQKTTLKQTGVIGTMAWIAPEILREEPASQKCDVYSYAVVLWELVTFQVPFEDLSSFQIMMKAANGEHPDIPSDCDKFFSDLIQRCWADNYKDRPSFEEILANWSP